MNKWEFLGKLESKLSHLPRQDVVERLHFYSEIIDDCVEEGLTEEEAVARIGSVDEIASQIAMDVPMVKLKEKKTEQTKFEEKIPESPKKGEKSKLRAWEIVLLCVGSPIWASLLIVAFAVAIALYALLWSLVAVAWAVFASFCAGVLGGIAGGVLLFIGGHVWTGIALIGAALFCGGLAIFTFFGCIAATKGTVKLTGILFRLMLKPFAGKGNSSCEK